MVLSAPSQYGAGIVKMGQTGRRPEQAVLYDLRVALERAGAELPDDSPWAAALLVLDGELRDGQPFLFRIALASSSRSKSDTPVVSS